MKKNKLDRISDLPDGIINNIFSFLDMRSVVQTSTLSKKWRNLWKSTSSFNFHLDARQSSKTEKRTAFISFVNEAIHRCHDTSKLHKFSLSCYQELEKKDIINSWLQAVLSRKVERINLYFTLHSHIELPDLLFSSDVEIFSFGICRLPHSICFASRIKCLELLEAILPKGDSNDELTLSCPVLENLILRDCRTNDLKVLTVSAPLLKTLNFKSSCDVCKINICCPNLTSLKWLGYIDGEYSLQNLSSLVSANISKYIHHGYMDHPAEGLVNVIRGIYNVRALTLSASLLKIITHHSELWEGNSTLFHNLRYMMLVDWNYEACVYSLADILGRLPRMETLVWNRIQEPYNLQSKESDWASIYSSQSKFSCLKTFEIRNPQAVEDELKFIAFLLQRAIVLKEIVVKTTKRNSFYRNRLTEFAKKASSLPLTSSGVSISFQCITSAWKFPASSISHEATT